MDAKTCTKCQESKTKDQFHKDAKGREGLMARCKQCMNEYRNAWRQTDHGRELTRLNAKRRYYTPDGQAYAKQYGRSEQHKAACRKYYKSPKGRAAAKRTWQKNKEKHIARRRVNYAVEKGRLPIISTQICFNCDNQAEHYHHHKGYDEKHWLDVVPVCVICHHDHT